MIKIGIRHNLIYPFMLLIFSSLREILSIIIKEGLKFEESLFLEYIMFLSVFVSGFIFFIYFKILYKSKKPIEEKEFMGIKLIVEEAEMNYPDNNYKILFLIFVAGFFDFITFLIGGYYIPKVNNELFVALKIPLISILITSYSSLLCFYFLKIKIQKHQKYALYTILTCLVIIIISNSCFIFISNNINTHYWGLIIFLIFFNYFFRSLIDVIEKYLLEYKLINPFLLIMLEGILGLLLSSSHLLIDNPFKEVKNYYNDNEKYKFILLIVCFILYFIFSGGKNIYARITNKLYSPMTWTLTDSMIDPFIFTYNFYFSEEKLEEQSSLFYIINITISVIIVFCACVYNELLVLYCCELHVNTHHEIARRASDVVDNLEYRLDEDNFST